MIVLKNTKRAWLFYAARSTFFLPEEEMTEEELLELIDFREKRDYSLAKITEEIEAGDYEYVKTEDSALPGDMSQESGSQQTQGAGEASVVPGADTAAQEWQVAYEGDVSIRCAAVAEKRSVCGRFHCGRTGESGISALRQRNARDVFEDLQKTERSTVCARHRTAASMRD